MTTTDLVPYELHSADFPETETLNANVAMAGLSTHTQRAYRRWIRRYLADVNQMEASLRKTISMDALNIAFAVNSLGPAPLKAWLGQLKANRLGKQSITQAKSAIVWLAQQLADVGRLPYETPAGLSRVKAPRAEVGQRSGTWLTPDEIRKLLKTIRVSEGANSPIAARNSAIIVLMVTCGLRRDEISGAQWADIARQGSNNVLRVHGKGEKLRTVKLPDMAIQALDWWRAHHPIPEGSRSIFTRIWKGGKVTTSGITDRAIWIVVQQAAKRAGLPKVSPHDLRRSFARGAFEAGVPFELIRQTLGHSNIATTERYVNSALELDHAATDIWAGTLDDE